MPLVQADRLMRIGSALLEPFGPGSSRLHFQFLGLANANSLLLSQLRFVAPSNTPSALITLNPTEAIATDYGGSLLTRAQIMPGRVAVVNREPVLTMHLAPAPTLTVYGQPGASYSIEYQPAFATPGNWQPLTSVFLVERFAEFELIGLEPILFFRAREATPAPGLKYDAP